MGVQYSSAYYNFSNLSMSNTTYTREYLLNQVQSRYFFVLCSTE